MNVWNSLGKLPVCLYPKIVQSGITPHVWGLPQSVAADMYDRHVRKTHLEVGPGPSPYDFCLTTSVTFMDVNAHVLKAAQAAVPHADVWRGDILNSSELPPQRFTSLGCFNVMHCIPDKNKWSRLMYSASRALEPGGVLFGATVLNTHPASRILNAAGIFHNRHDSLDDIALWSREGFRRIYLKQVGSCAIFALAKVSRPPESRAQHAARDDRAGEQLGACYA